MVNKKREFCLRKDHQTPTHMCREASRFHALHFLTLLVLFRGAAGKVLEALHGVSDHGLEKKSVKKETGGMSKCVMCGMVCNMMMWILMYDVW